MTSTAETVFGIPELLDQILKDVYASDIFVFQRVNRRFCQTIQRTSHVRPRRLARVFDPDAAQSRHGEVQADFSLLFASRFFLSFLNLEPFVFEHCSVLKFTATYSVLHLRYIYTPKSATARRLWPSDRVYPYTANIAMRRGNKTYETSPSWAHVWLPNLAIRTSLEIYRHEHKHRYTETMELDSDKADMHSVATALNTLAARSEVKWSSGQIVGGWTI